MAGKSSRLAILLDLDGSQFEKGLNRSLSRFKSAGKQMQAAGKNLSVGLTAPLALVGASSFKVAADFELAMAKVAAVSGGGDKALQDLTAQAKNLGATTSFSASQVSELQLELSKLGFSSGELVGQDGLPGMTDSVLNLSKAFDTGLGETAEVVGATLRQFGLKAKDTQNVTDVMAKAFGSSALDLTKFSEGMKNVAPVANEFGFSLTETSSLLGVLANNGIAGSDAGTKLKMAFSELAKSGVPVKETFTKLIQGGTGYTEAMELLGTRAAILGPVFGKNLEDLSNLNTELENSTGTAQEMSDMMGNTAAGKLAEMQSAVEAAQIELGTALAPTVLEVANVIRDLASSFANLDQGTKDTIVKIGLAAASLGPLLIVGGKVTTAVTSISGAFKLMGKGAEGGAMKAASGFKRLIPLLMNPAFLAGAAAITAISLALAPVVKRLTSMEFKMRTAAGATREMNKAVAEERAEVTTLFSKLKLAAKGERDRSEAVKEINGRYGEYLGNLDLNTASLEDIEKAEKAVTDAVAKRVRAQLLAETTKKQAEAQATVEKILLDFEVEAIDSGAEVDEIARVSDATRALFASLAAGEIDVQGFRDGLAVIKDSASRDLAFALRTATDSGGMFGTGMNGAAIALNDAALATRNMERMIERLDGKTEEVTDATEDATDATQENTDATEANADAKGKAEEAAKKQAKTLADTVQELAKTLADTTTTESVFGEDFGKRDEDRVRALSSAINEIISEGFTGDVDLAALKLTGDELTALGQILGEGFTGDADAILAALVARFEELQPTVAATETPLDALRAKMAELQTLERIGLIDGLEAAQSALTALEDAMRESILNDPEFEGSEAFTKMAAEIDRMRKGLEGVEEQSERNKKKFDKEAEAQKALTDLASTTVDALFDKNQKLGESLAEAAKGIAKSLIKQALATAISNAVASAFSPASPDNILTGGAAAPAKAAGLVATAKTLFSQIPAFAEGGAVLGGRGGTLALIGEKPSSRGEFIVPFEKLGRFMDMAGAGSNVDIAARVKGDVLELSSRRSARKFSRKSIV